jgi:hypothetical protein
MSRAEEKGASGRLWICGQNGVRSVAEDGILPAVRAARQFGRTGLLGVGGSAFALALLEAEAAAVHLQDVDMVGEAVEQRTG